jgi:hypothetical protein
MRIEDKLDKKLKFLKLLVVVRPQKSLQLLKMMTMMMQ